MLNHVVSLLTESVEAAYPVCTHCCRGLSSNGSYSHSPRDQWILMRIFPPSASLNLSQLCYSIEYLCAFTKRSFIFQCYSVAQFLTSRPNLNGQLLFISVRWNVETNFTATALSVQWKITVLCSRCYWSKCVCAPLLLRGSSVHWTRCQWRDGELLS